MEINRPSMVLLQKRICLGIESTAHTFGVGIVDSKGRIIADKKSSFRTDFGIKPQEAARSHLKNAKRIIKEALDEAEIKISDCDIISFARGPGLGPCLKVGATCARAIALANKKPIVPVNHCLAHIEIGRLNTNAKDPLVVYVSGGNTQIISLKDGAYRIFGETLDIGLGNMLDSFGRSLGYGFPAGPVLDEIYFEGKKYIPLPYTVKGTDLAFAGLETAAKRLIGKVSKEDLIFSTLHNAFAMLTEATERALAYTEKKEVLIVGGVAASKALRQIMLKMCISRGAKLLVPQKSFCTDNGAMIAWLGILEYENGSRVDIRKSNAEQRVRLEDEKVTWV